MTAPLIHLVCGSTGAGKTTYTLKLCTEIGAVRFSIDEWMTALFWMDSPQLIDGAWSMARVERCLTQIWATAAQVATRGVPCVLDVGLTRAADRERFYRLASAAGLSARLHFVDVTAAERWRRVQARNASPGETHQLSFAVTREMFDFVETLWEPPSAAEMRDHHGLRV